MFDTPDDIASGTMEEGLLPRSEGCPWMDLTGLACHLTRTYKGLSKRLILMPTYRCSVHAEEVLAFIQRDGSQSYPPRDRNTRPRISWESTAVMAR